MYVHIYAHIFVQEQKILLQTVVFRSISCTPFRKIQPTYSYSCEETYRGEVGIRVEVPSQIRNIREIVSAGLITASWSIWMLLTDIFICVTYEKENYIDRK